MVLTATAISTRQEDDVVVGKKEGMRGNACANTWKLGARLVNDQKDGFYCLVPCCYRAEAQEHDELKKRARDAGEQQKQLY